MTCWGKCWIFSFDVNDGNGNNERIHAWWISAEYLGDRYLLYLHGSALNIGANITHARRCHQIGFSVFLVSYRGYGKSDGTFPTEAHVYADARAARTYLVEQKGIDPDNRTAASKQLKLIIGGGYNNSAAVGGEEYLQAVRNFINFANDAIWGTMNQFCHGLQRRFRSLR